MNNNTKAARESRIERIKARGQYRYANMTAAERAKLPEGYWDSSMGKKPEPKAAKVKKK